MHHMSRDYTRLRVGNRSTVARLGTRDCTAARIVIDRLRAHAHTHTHTRTDSAIRVPSPSASPLSSTDTAYRAHTSKTHFTMSSWHAARCCSNRLLIIANECGTSWVVITTAIRRPFESGFELSTSIIDHATTTVRLMLRP